MDEARTFRAELDAAIDDHALLEHPFYVAWTEGELTQEMLAAYAKQYYQHVEAFPRYISRVHAATEDRPTREALVENLHEEEGGDVAHPDLWLDFAEALGADREAVQDAEALPEVREAVESFLDLASRGPIEGVAALYAYESQIPEVSETKVEGLEEFYGITEEEATAYFDLHAEVDVEHADEEFAVLDALCETEGERRRAVEAAEAGAAAASRILDGVWREHCGALHDGAAA
jgi:pyrroloquinoline-quinone synthase